MFCLRLIASGDAWGDKCGLGDCAITFTRTFVVCRTGCRVAASYVNVFVQQLSGAAGRLLFCRTSCMTGFFLLFFYLLLTYLNNIYFLCIALTRWLRVTGFCFLILLRLLRFLRFLRWPQLVFVAHFFQPCLFFYIFHCFYCFYCFSAFVIAMLSVSRVARKQQAWICITDFQWQQRCIGASAIFNAAINGFAGAEKHALSFVDLQCRTNSENGVSMQILKFSCKKFTAACSGKSKMYTLSFQLLLLCVFFLVL